MAARLFAVPATILRLFSVYGPGQVVGAGQSGVVAILGQRAVAGRPMVVLSHQQKDFVEVSDAVDALERAMAHASTPARTYNIGAGRPVRVLELARALNEVAASASPIVEDYSESDPGALVADIGRARAELGYEPRITLEEGLHRYVDWLRSARPSPA
jgi:nucleoside-diphosphate-sugar epimerase